MLGDEGILRVKKKENIHSRAQLQVLHHEHAEGEKQMSLHSNVCAGRGTKALFVPPCFSNGPAFKIGNTKYKGTRTEEGGRDDHVSVNITRNWHWELGPSQMVM